MLAMTNDLELTVTDVEEGEIFIQTSFEVEINHPGNIRTVANKSC